MERGFNFLFQGNRSNFGGRGGGPNFRDDRRYDNYYDDRRVGGPGPNRVGGGGRYNQTKSWNVRRGGGPRVGDKRRNDIGRKFSPAAKKKTTSKDIPKKEKEDKEEVKIEEIPDIPDDEVVVPDSLMDAVEGLRQRKEIERNAADEDVQKLVVFCFTGKGYQCKSCGLLLTKEPSFVSHLNGKTHVMNVVEARTAKKYQDVRDILDIDLTPDDWFEKNETAHAIIMKQSKLHMKTQREIKAKEEANYNKMPSNFFNFNMELRKSVIKKEEKVVITSLVESTVEVTDFTGERFFGCEFVRAVTGFHCRLCSINIREAKGVIPHIDSKQHKNNYAAYVKKNSDYEKSQKEQSQELFDVMNEHEGKSIVLAESTDVTKSHFLSVLDDELVRIPTVMNPELKKQKEKEEKEKKEKEEKDKKEKEEKEKEKEEEAAADENDESEDAEKGDAEDTEDTGGDEDGSDEVAEGDKEADEDDGKAEEKEEEEEDQVDEDTEEPNAVEEPMEEDSKEKESECNTTKEASSDAKKDAKKT